MRRGYPSARWLLTQWVAACLVLVSCSGRSLAQQSGAGPLMAPRSPAQAESASAAPPLAVEHYNRGRELYQAGRYREAVVELQRASELDPQSANLVYNIGRVYELLGEIDLSIEYYQRYRDMLPPSEVEESARVEGTIQRLRGAREQVQRDRAEAEAEAETAPSPGSAQTEPPRRGVADAAFWTVAGGAAATLLVGGVLGVFALRGERSASRFVLGRDGDAKQRDGEVERADRLALSSDVLVASGAALGVTALLLYALRTQPSNARVSVSVDALRGGAVFGLRGRL